MPKVIIYTDIWGEDRIPHTFLGLTDKDGTTIYRGFSPDKPGLWGNGSVKDEFNYKQGRLHEYQRAYEIEISQEKYEILRDIIEENKSRQIFYNLPLGIQCTVWAMNVLQKAGVINQFIKPNMNMTEFYGDFYSRVMGEELGRPFGEFIGNFTGVTQTLLYNPYMQEIGFKLNEFKENIKNYISPLSISLYDPLILDLNGNGKIDLTSTSNGVHFDHDANDISFKSSWVDKEDGLLVYDRNNNGIIDNGTELFGNFTRITSANTNSSAYENIDDANKNNNNLQTNNTTLAKHGYEALANLDSNNDGVIDINDKDFNKLRIWQDINKDGVSQINELKTLDELNIKSLNLNYKEVNQDLGDNNTLTLKGSYTKTNGQTMLMGDINFNVDTINSKFKEDVNLTLSQIKTPNVKGYGYLRDLNKAASIDTNLANILDNYSKSNTKEEQLKILPTLIKAWSDTSNNINNNLNPMEKPNNNDTDKTKDQREYDISLTKIKLPNNISISDGTNVKVDSSGNIVSNDHKSARNLRLTPSQYRALMNNSQEIDKNLALEFESIKDKIRVIGAFSGQKTTALNYIDPSEVRAIIDNVNATYDKILNYTYNSLLPQTRLKEYVSLIDIKAKEAKDENGNVKYEFSMDYSKVIGKFEETIKKTPKRLLWIFGEFINATMKNDSNLDASLISVFAQAISLVAKDGSLEQMQKELKVYQDVKYTVGSGKVAGTNGKDLVFGSDGDDTISSYGGNDILYGNAASEALKFAS